MQPQMPKALNYRGRMLNFAGSGRTPGSFVYMDMGAGGVSYEMFLAQVSKTGPHFVLAVSGGNPSLSPIRIDNVVLNSQGVGAPMLGDRMIVGPLNYELNGPTALGVWRITTPPPVPFMVPRPMGGLRNSGVITWVAPTGSHGFITSDQAGLRVFVHRSSLRPGTYLACGMRVRYLQGDNGKGPAAFEVGPA